MVLETVCMFTVQKNEGNTQTLQCNSKSITLLGYPPAQVGSNTDCESISPAVVQMEKQQVKREAICKTTPKKGMVLQVVATDHLPVLILSG